MMRVEQHHDLMLKVVRPRLTTRNNMARSAAARSSTSTSTYTAGEANKRAADESSASSETGRDVNDVVCDDHQIYNNNSDISDISNIETSSTYDL